MNSELGISGEKDVDASTQQLIQAVMKAGETARSLKNGGKFSDALAEYKRAVKLFAPNLAIPGAPGTSEAVRNDTYVNYRIPERMILIQLCNETARCLEHEKNLVDALAWVEESRVLLENARLSSKKPLFDWALFDANSKAKFPMFSSEREKTFVTASDLFFALGNTGTALFHRHTEQRNQLTGNETDRYMRHLKETDNRRVQELMEYRHPDPALVAKQEIIDPELQVRGSWGKVKGSGYMQKINFSSFIWGGRLFVAGGRKNSWDLNCKGDLWSLDLSQPSSSWREEPTLPNAPAGAMFSWSTVVNDDKAYVINGRPRIDFFNLKTRKWSSIQTTFERSSADRNDGIAAWPWKSVLQGASTQTSNNKIYVFGGTDGNTNIGNNLFMELDLQTKKWKRLGGYPVPTPDYSMPGCRKTPSSWINKERTKLYLLFGEAELPGGKLHGERYAGDDGYAQPDFWSWSFGKKEWTRERWAGNYPCPRSETAVVYNPILDCTVVFGGYNPNMPSDAPATATSPPKQFMFTYYADTFIFNAATSTWRQVITRGFPTYRCQCQLLCDPKTGNMYMFGGFTNSDAVPDVKGDYRSFGDVWQLRIDVPGGKYEEVNEEEEKRTAKAGPWQRCFNCASVGAGWKKCGGTCKGRVLFCSNECLKDGWKEHKQMHDCRKN